MLWHWFCFLWNSEINWLRKESEGISARLAEREMAVFSAVDANSVFCLFEFLKQLGWIINQTDATAKVGTSLKGNKGINQANLPI